MGHWTPTGVEPKDYDDDDDCHYRNLDEWGTFNLIIVNYWLVMFA